MIYNQGGGVFNEHVLKIVHMNFKHVFSLNIENVAINWGDILSVVAMFCNLLLTKGGI